MNRKHWFRCLLAFAIAIAVGSTAMAADKPQLTLLVGYPPGGGTDSLARILAEELRISLDRVVVVDNKPGAGGRISAQALAKAPGDGNTLLLAPNGLTTVQTIVYKDSLNYKPTDLVPVAMLVNTPLALAVSTDTKVQDVKQLAEWIRAKPQDVTFGSPSAGGLPHFAGLLIAKAMGSQWVHVPYRGGAPVAMALISNEVPIGLSTIDDFAQQGAAGKLRIIGVASPKRSTLAPDVPTLVEQGLDVKLQGWTALWTSPGTPPSVITALSAAVQKALANPAVRNKLERAQMEPAYLPAAELQKVQKDEWSLFEPVIAASGFKPN